MKEGAVDALNGWHFNHPGYLNSWQRMCYQNYLQTRIIQSKVTLDLQTLNQHTRQRC